MSRVFLASARRSATVPRGGALAALPLHDLVAPVIAAALTDARTGADEVQELILSNALGAGGNPARLAALAGPFGQPGVHQGRTVGHGLRGCSG